MKQEIDENGIKYTEYEGEEVIGNIIKSIEYPNGRIKEYKQLSRGGYWIDYPQGKNKVSIPLACPKCNKLMDWLDEKVFLEKECCEQCERINEKI